MSHHQKSVHNDKHSHKHHGHDYEHEHHDHHHEDDYENDFDIYPKQFVSLIDQDDFSGVILDVRDSWEWEEYRISGSLSIPFRELAMNIHKLDPQKSYYVLGTQGLYSSYAVSFLATQGFENVYNVQMGMEGLIEQLAIDGHQPDWLLKKESL